MLAANLFRRATRFRCTSVFSLLLMLLGSTWAHSEQTQVFGDYDVHYSVLNTTFLSPQIAESYQIVRGKNRSLVNIAVRKRLSDGSSQAARAQLSGESSDLIHRTELAFREVVEQDAIYYIAELEFHHMEMRSFNIRVQPEGEESAYMLKFSKTLYADQESHQ